MGFAVFCRKLRRNPPLEVGAADEVRQQLHDMGRYNLLDEDALNDWAVGALYASDPSKVARFALPGFMRSEERRVGKECRSRWSPYH